MEEVIRKSVEVILDKGMWDENDMAVLRARESYLTEEEKEKVGLLKKEKAVSKKKK